MAAEHNPWMDNEAGYGRVTRLLHWLMAALLAWQFTSAALHALAEDTAIERFFWSTHTTLGFFLLVLACVRGIWGLLSLGQRPARTPGMWGRAAGLGHLVLYVLMIAVPALALARSYGRGRGFSVLGVQIFEPGGQAVPALVEAGNALHGWLGWLLLALVVGHIVMAFAHRPVNGSRILHRMTRGAVRA